jgi:hypothetical protein
MKKLALTLILVATAALGGNYTLDWTASPSPGVAYYKTFSSTNSTGTPTWVFLRSVTNATTTIVSNITAPPVIQFAVSAVSTNGSESSKATAPIIFAPGNLTITEAP